VSTGGAGFLLQPAPPQRGTSGDVASLNYRTNLSGKIKTSVAGI